jgi:predicted DNA-binding transcriptional regulator AlpA
LAKKKKPTAAEQARAAFDADPPPPVSDAALAQLIKQRPVVETQRPPPRRLIGRDEMLSLVPYTYPALIDLMKRGLFPRARLIGKKLGWLEEEYEQWRVNLPLQRWKGEDDET